MTSKRALRIRVTELEAALRDAQSDLAWYRKPDPEPAKDASLEEAERIVRHIADNWTGPSGAYKTLLEAYDRRTTALTGFSDRPCEALAIIGRTCEQRGPHAVACGVCNARAALAAAPTESEA